MGWKLAVAGLCGVLALHVLSGCSSAPPPPPPAPVTQAQPGGPPQLIDAGFEVQTATAVGVVESIDSTQRKFVLKHGDGSTKGYKAGKEVQNFPQLKVGDEVVATVTEACAIFLVKGGVTPGAVAGGVFAKNPKGTSPGGVALETLDYNAKILDIDRENRHVILQYGTNAANVFNVGPNINLAEINIGDDVLVRATESMALLVEGKAKP